MTSTPLRAALLATVLSATVVHAQEGPPGSTLGEGYVAPFPDAEDDFGPVVEIERIDVVGNSRTAGKLIRRALLVHEGDRLRTGDSRLLASRYRVLALGYFRDALLRLEKGSRRGAVVLTVAVEERGTFTLNRVFLGNSDITPIWLGVDIGDANFLGSGIAVGAAFVWASEMDLPGGEPQTALRLRLSDPSLFGSDFGARGAFLYNRASEPVAGTAHPYRRAGGSVGATWQATRLALFSLDARLETIAGGETPPPSLLAGDSVLFTLAAGFDLDTRRDPVLPDDGMHLALVVEGGGGPFPGGDYDELRVFGRWQGWRKLGGRHVGSLQLGGGIIAGDAPMFDRFYIGDVDALMPPRALDLVVSDRESPDILGGGTDQVSYGRVYAGASVEYAFQLFRGRRTVYGGDLFASVGVFALGETDDLHADLTFDAGLRLDTFIGVFELSLGNALGRIPF